MISAATVGVAELVKNRPVKSEDTKVVVSVTERSQRDLTKRFDETDIDWGVIERQLIKWAELFCAGHELQKHEDVPEDIREQLYAEEQQWLERRQRTSNTSTASFPPINIANVLPPHAYQMPLETSPARTLPSNLPPTLVPVTRLDISGPRDLAVKNYIHWQQSKVNDDILKVEFRKACDITLADGLDLEQVYEDRHRTFFIDKGVKGGIARRFVDDIDQWAKRHRRAETEE
ncbi:hypothetical protein BcDW1_2127 [Botrytis cinerea BcDW1]|uniref:Uncharacterized protein n=1 Tax=Botryotinia fuckeliana (strain BcDW1) TaxID=1290391 RepID=M7U052_BOTF1|nr:hypothetical protein BcDW1_2127 [Botrytis cinerea BcDW1]